MEVVIVIPFHHCRAEIPERALNVGHQIPGVTIEALIGKERTPQCTV